MKKDFVMPIINLLVFCAVISGVLSYSNAITEPIIAAAAAQRAEEARKEIIPDADTFLLMEVENLPNRITEVYGTDNNKGFIFMITTVGYGGDINLICGIDLDGKIIKTATLKETETKGIATPVFGLEPLYVGNDKTLAGIDAISGATITSKAYMNGILEAFEAFEMVKEVRF